MTTMMIMKMKMMSQTILFRPWTLFVWMVLLASSPLVPPLQVLVHALPVAPEDAQLSTAEHCELYCREYYQPNACAAYDIASNRRSSRRAKRLFFQKKIDIAKCTRQCTRSRHLDHGVLQTARSGSPQDFMHVNTIQCRRNHIHMQIQEQSLANSDHCLHAMFRGRMRCNPQSVRTRYYHQILKRGERLFQTAAAGGRRSRVFNKAIAIATGLFYEGALRGRLMTRYPYFDVENPLNITCDSDIDSNDDSHRFRSADGTCNSLDMPTMGAVGTPLISTLLPSAPRTDLPNVADVAAILQRPPQDNSNNNNKRLAPFNQLCVGWIQFMTHDWFQHDSRNPTDPTNLVTHWWDASQLYGSTADEQAAVRSATHPAKLHLDDHQEMDYDTTTDGTTSKPITGFTDNWWVGLHLFHTVFAREHNYVVDQLEAAYPGQYTDDQLFQLARLSVSALLAKIHTIEWTPTLLPNPITANALFINWYGVEDTFLKRIGNRVELFLAFRGVGGFQYAPYAGSGDHTDQTLYNTTFAMTEEFVSVYRMHPLLPDELSIGDRDFTLNELSFVDARELVRDSLNDDDNKNNVTLALLHTFGETPARTLSLQNYPRQLYNLTKPGHDATIHLAEIDLLRDRQRNLPRYNDMRRQLLLEPHTKLRDLTSDPDELALLESVYTDIDQVDLMVGSLVDQDRPAGFAFGIVPFHVFVVMASRRILNDRFLMQDFTKDVYTAWGYEYVQRESLRSVLLRQFPSLEDRDIPQNPFMNWT